MEASQVRVVQAAMAEIISANHLPVGVKIRLTLSTFTPTPNSTKADFDANRVAALDIADVTTTLAFLSGVDAVNRALLISQELFLFAPAGTATFPILAGGWYIVDSTNTFLLASGTLDDPVSFDNALDQLLLKPEIYFDALSDADAEFIDAP